MNVTINVYIPHKYISSGKNRILIDIVGITRYWIFEIESRTKRLDFNYADAGAKLNYLMSHLLGTFRMSNYNAQFFYDYEYRIETIHLMIGPTRLLVDDFEAFICFKFLPNIDRVIRTVEITQ